MIRVVLFLSVFAVGGQAVFAQVNTLKADGPRENAALKLGPFYVSPRISLTEFGVDTNVFNQAGERERDFTFTLAPIAQVWVPVAQRGLLKATLGSDLVWYKEFASERSIDPHMTFRGEAYVRRFTFFGETSFLHTRQRPTFEIDLRSRRMERALTAGVDMRLTPKISLQVHGTTSKTDYDSDPFFNLQETLNRRSVGFSAVGRYRLSVLTSFVLRTERFEERFPLSPARGADNVRIMPGVEFQPRALVSGSAFIGVRHLNPVDEAVLPEFSGFVSDLNLSYTMLGSTTVGVSLTRDINYSFELLQPYYVDTGAGIRARRALGPRFDVVIFMDRHTYSYRDLIRIPDGSTPTGRNRVDTIWNYGSSLGIRLGREGRIGFGATYWRRNSTTRSSRNYEGLRIGTTATYGF